MFKRSKKKQKGAIADGVSNQQTVSPEDEKNQKIDNIIEDCNKIQIGSEKLDDTLNVIVGNIKDISSKANMISTGEAERIEEIARISSASSSLKKEQDKLFGEIENRRNEFYEIVDNNKHFTSPTKTISQHFELLSRTLNTVKELQEQMAQHSREMSVTALNCAIEAGRLGESGREFMNAAQDVRDLSEKFEEAARDLREATDELFRKQDRTQEQMQKLNQLLKDNNINMTKSASAMDELYKTSSKCSVNKLDEDIKALRAQAEFDDDSLAKDIMEKSEESLDKMQQAGDIFITQQQLMSDIKDNTSAIKE